MGTLGDIWGALPLAAFAGLVAGQVRRGRAPVEALLRAAVFWAAGVWVLANAVGLFAALRPGPLRLAWLLLAAVAIADGFRQRVKWCWPRPRGAREWVAVLAIGALLLLALVTAVAAPPGTVDVLNYHLPRQLMWLQQGSLEHFDTVNDRELMMPPLAEVIGLQFLALTGDDHWVNLPQWFAYALLPLAALVTVRALGASRPAALLAAWLVVCLPMAYLEAANGKNDLQGAFWLALLTWQVAVARGAAGPPGWREGVVAGLTVALALLTKSTALIFAPPLVVAGLLAWGRHGGRPAARIGVIAALTLVMFVTPFYARNLAWYHTPLGIHTAEEGGDQTNDAHTPAIVLSNALRNATLHLAASSPAWNQLLERTVRAAHRWLGLSEDDPRSTLWITRYGVDYYPWDETAAGAPWHLLAIGAAVVWVWCRRDAGGAAAGRWLAVSVMVMVVLYCAVLKWQPWGARLQLPVFVTGSMLVAVVAGGAARRPGLLCLLTGLLGLAAWWPSREDQARPLWTAPSLFAVPRDVNRYRHHADLMARDAKMAALLRATQVHEVAVVSLHDIAYNLMRQLPGMHFYGAPAVAAGDRPPEAVVILNYSNPLALYHEMAGGARYRLVGDSAGDGLYLPADRVRALGWERRLPAFAGWTGAKNLPMTVATPVVLDAPVTTLVMVAPTAAVSFPVSWEGGRARLTGTVRKLRPGAGWVEFTCNGEPAGRVELTGTGPQDFAFSLSCRAGPNQLELRRAEGAEEVVEFTRLEIADSPSP